MLTTLYVLHWVAAFVIALQSSDRIFQCPLMERGIAPMERFYRAIKGIAWAVMAFASFGVLAAPFFRWTGFHGISLALVNQPPNISEVGIYTGFALLILRSWIREFATIKAQSRPRLNPVNSGSAGAKA